MHGWNTVVYGVRVTDDAIDKGKLFEYVKNPIPCAFCEDLLIDFETGAAYEDAEKFYAEAVAEYCGDHGSSGVVSLLADIIDLNYIDALDPMECDPCSGYIGYAAHLAFPWTVCEDVADDAPWLAFTKDDVESAVRGCLAQVIANPESIEFSVYCLDYIY